MTNPTLLAPTLAPGVSLLGEYQGSGFTEPHYLIVRADQQVLHVSRLLFVVASHLDGRSSMEEIAGRVEPGVRPHPRRRGRPVPRHRQAPPDGHRGRGRGRRHRRARLVRAPPRDRPRATPPRAGSTGTATGTGTAGGAAARSPRPDGASRSSPSPREPVAGAPVPRHAHPRLGHAVPRAPARAVLLRTGRRARDRRARRRGRLAAAPGQPDRRRRLDPGRPADAALRDRDPAGRHGRPRARPRGRLPLRRRDAGKDRRRGLHRLPRLLHRRHAVLPARSRRPGPHRPRRRLLQRPHDRRADGGVCAYAVAGGPARHRLRPRRGAPAAASARSPRRVLRRRRPRRRARPVRAHRPDPPQCRSGASDPPEGRRAAPVGAGRRHPLGGGHRADHGGDPRVHAVERARDHGSGGRRDEPRMDATAGVDRRSRRGRYHPGRSVPRLVAAASAGPRLAGRRHPAPHRRCRGPTAPASPNPPIDRGHPVPPPARGDPDVRIGSHHPPDAMAASRDAVCVGRRRVRPGPGVGPGRRGRPARRTSSPNASCCGPSRVLLDTGGAAASSP